MQLIYIALFYNINHLNKSVISTKSLQCESVQLFYFVELYTFITLSLNCIYLLHLLLLMFVLKTTLKTVTQIKMCRISEQNKLLSGYAFCFITSL